VAWALPAATLASFDAGAAFGNADSMALAPAARPASPPEPGVRAGDAGFRGGAALARCPPALAPSSDCLRAAGDDLRAPRGDLPALEDPFADAALRAEVDLLADAVSFAVVVFAGAVLFAEAGADRVEALRAFGALRSPGVPAGSADVRAAGALRAAAALPFDPEAEPTAAAASGTAGACAAAPVRCAGFPRDLLGIVVPFVLLAGIVRSFCTANAICQNALRRSRALCQFT
jgi:hypothetical protein